MPAVDQDSQIGEVVETHGSVEPFRRACGSRLMVRWDWVVVSGVYRSVKPIESVELCFVFVVGGSRLMVRWNR